MSPRQDDEDLLAQRATEQPADIDTYGRPNERIACLRNGPSSIGTSSEATAPSPCRGRALRCRAAGGWRPRPRPAVLTTSGETSAKRLTRRSRRSATARRHRMAPYDWLWMSLAAAPSPAPADAQAASEHDGSVLICAPRRAAEPAVTLANCTPCRGAVRGSPTDCWWRWTPWRWRWCRPTRRRRRRSQPPRRRARTIRIRRAAQRAADTRDSDGDGIYCVIYSG
jgi:hypothetical protein